MFNRVGQTTNADLYNYKFDGGELYAMTSGGRTLDLYCKGLSADGLVAALGDLETDGWSELRLDCNPFGDAGAEALAAWPGLAGAEILDLVDTEVGWRGLTALAASPFAPRPVELRLDENPLYNRGVILLAGSPMVARLRHLGLSCTGISHKGVEALVASPHLAGLEVLDLTQTQLLRRSWRLLAERFPTVIGSPISEW
ncbi:MAG: hypothetical protein C0467_13805 [Planctomycetaceae bacterium]|nr:hypothetical protein [Planctomycetaceae bacterium]